MNRRRSARARPFRPPPASGDLAGILGASRAIQRVRDVVVRVAPTPATVLVTGESGTGKELVARAIHARSRRAEGPFVAVNCAALAPDLLESELFGHAKGAFTDAKSARRGLLVEADGGTLFLDEIGEMPLPAQVKLLRALQERRVRPVGGAVEIAYDARIVAATHRNLRADVALGRFRQDLFYRVHVVTIDVPPLRERPDDIALLASAFVERFAHTYERASGVITPAALALLRTRRWPGNVRELENAIESAFAMTSSERLEPHHFTDESPAHETAERARELSTAAVHEQRYREHVLASVDGDKSRAAEILGYDRRTLHRKLKRAKTRAPS